MSNDLMSDAELRRRRKLQGKIGRTTSTLGLGGLGITGAAALASRKPGMLKAIPKAKNLTPEKLRNTAINTGIVSGGIGGVGGFNQASIYSDEARRRKQTVKKELGMDMGYYGEEGRPLTHEEIEAEIEKAWSPSASNFDSEASRKKRADAYGGAALAGAGAGGAYAAHHGMKAVHEAKGLKPHLVAEVARDAKGAAKISTARANHYKAISTGSLKAVGRSGGKAAAGLAAVAGAAATHSAIKRKKSNSWQPYAKRDTTSAFGVDHSDNPNGQHRETEN